MVRRIKAKFLMIRFDGANELIEFSVHAAFHLFGAGNAGQPNDQRREDADNSNDHQHFRQRKGVVESPPGPRPAMGHRPAAIGTGHSLWRAALSRSRSSFSMRSLIHCFIMLW